MLLAVAPLVVGQGFTLSGRVLYEDGMRPADMVVVSLRNFTDMGFEQANTDVHGNFTFRVPRGVYYLTIRMTGYAEVSERVEVGVFSSTGIMLYLRKLPEKKADQIATTSSAGTVAAEYLKIPVNAREHYETGMKLFQREGKLDEGLVHLRKAVEFHPDFALAYYGMGMLLMDLDRLDEARDSFQSAIARNDKLLHAYFPLGAIQNQQRRFVEAEKLLRHGLEIKEDIWQLHFELARAIAYQGRWEEAEKSALRAAALNVDAPKVHLLLANIYLELGKPEQAMAAAEEFLRLAPTDPVAPQIRARLDEIRASRPPK